MFFSLQTLKLGRAMNEAVDAQCSVDALSRAKRPLRLGAKPPYQLLGGRQYNRLPVAIDAGGVERIL